MGIRHTVPAGLPTGTSAGKVAGDDWRADHLHVPFEVFLMGSGNTAVAGTASAAANAELFTTSKITRTRIDLSVASQFRLEAMVTALGNAAGAAIKLQYTTTNAATWSGADLGATTNNLVIGTGTAGTMFDLGWQNLATAAKADNLYIAAAVAVAFGTTAPSFGSLQVYFR